MAKKLLAQKAAGNTQKENELFAMNEMGFEKKKVPSRGNL